MSGEVKKPVMASARATVTVEVFGLGNWGDDCAMDQVYRQAEQQARGRIENALRDKGKFTILDCKVTAVLAERS